MFTAWWQSRAIAGTQNSNLNKMVVLPKGLLLFVFLPLKGKQIKRETLRPLRLCGEYCFVKDPLRVTIRSTLFRGGIAYCT